MFKMLVLQQWHGLSDFKIEKQCIDRISFRKSLGLDVISYYVLNYTIYRSIRS